MQQRNEPSLAIFIEIYRRRSNAAKLIKKPILCKCSCVYLIGKALAIAVSWFVYRHCPYRIWCLCLWIADKNETRIFPFFFFFFLFICIFIFSCNNDTLYVQLHFFSTRRRKKAKGYTDTRTSNFSVNTFVIEFWQPVQLFLKLNGDIVKTDCGNLVYRNKKLIMMMETLEAYIIDRLVRMHESIRYFVHSKIWHRPRNMKYISNGKGRNIF